MSVNVKNGTPMHGPSLCETCTRAHVAKGFRQSPSVSHLRIYVARTSRHVFRC